MKKTLKNLLAASLVAAAFSGCAGSNPFGVGHEKSSCEISSGFGVCGSPKDIYIHKDVIKKVQKDYMKSGSLKNYSLLFHLLEICWLKRKEKVLIGKTTIHLILEKTLWKDFQKKEALLTKKFLLQK